MRDNPSATTSRDVIIPPCESKTRTTGEGNFMVYKCADTITLFGTFVNRATIFRNPSHGRGGGGRGGKKVVDCRALRGRGALVAPEIGRDGSRPSRISCLLHFYTSTRPFLRRRGRRRYGCRCWRGRTPLATACAAHFVRGICRYGCRCWRGRTPLATACAAHFVRGICRHCQLYFYTSTRLRLFPTTARAPSPLPSTNFAPRWEGANSHRNSVV